MPDANSGTPTVALRHEGGELDLPVKPATEGSPGIDVAKLLSKTGMVTLDPGFVNTAACSSEITYIDGDAGILRYRGYPIDQLAEKSNFIEVSYLLIYGELPTQAQLDEFTDKIKRHTLLHEDLKRFFDGFPRRSEEHTSELQSLTNIVCRLLLEKKKGRPGQLLRGPYLSFPLLWPLRERIVSFPGR